MGVTFTKEQQQVIDLRNRNILVSAAAGSGKTAVLVERIITRLTKDESPLNVDQLLIVTFTSAAAAEMKERIHNAIEKALEDNQENEHLQRQATLIHQAQITTIHQFCLSVIKDYFHTIDLDPSFRVGEEGELKLLQQDVVNDVLEIEFQEGKPEFMSFVECFSPGKDDKNLDELILQLYKFSRSYPNPNVWLDLCAEQYAVASAKELEEKSYVQELIAGINQADQNNNIDMVKLEEIVRTDNKQRYSFNEDKTLIRANQGHSIPVDVELEEVEPPEYLWHGTGQKYMESIDKEGLVPKSRLYVHLSGDVETATNVGKRHGKLLMYKVLSKKMVEDGYKFYRSVNGVWLTKSVPVKYLEKQG